MKRILVAVDGSDPARRATARAADLASRLGYGLTIVHVLPPPPIFSEPAVLPDMAELERRVYEKGRAVLDEAAAQAARTGLQVDTKLLSGPPGEVIAEASQAEDVDFVVVGSRGRTLVGSMLLGGTSHRLIHVCKKPILVVH
jgi:nucleotide-binding universal stress UspA family protein